MDLVGGIFVIIVDDVFAVSCAVFVDRFLRPKAVDIDRQRPLLMFDQQESALLNPQKAPGSVIDSAERPVAEVISRSVFRGVVLHSRYWQMKPIENTDRFGNNSTLWIYNPHAVIGFNRAQESNCRIVCGFRWDHVSLSSASISENEHRWLVAIVGIPPRMDRPRERDS